MLRLDLRLGDKAEWIKIFDPRDATVFVSADEPPTVGEVVRVDLIVGVGGPRVILRGKVVARRMKGDASLARGFNLALGAEESAKVGYLNAFVRGGMIDLRERRRLPLRFTVVYGGLRSAVTSHTRDLHEEGMFIVSEAPLEPGSELNIILTVPVRKDPIQLTGIVSHTVEVDDEDLPGMGIRFTLDGERAAEMVRLVDELELLFLENKLDEGHLL